MRVKVALPHVNDVALFVAKCGEHPFEINCICGKYVVDAKSVMGVLSMGIRESYDIEILCDDEELLQKYLKEISMWRI